jgi:hypothetical protein
MTFDFDVLFRDTEEPSEKIPRGKLERQMLQFRHNPMMIAFRSKSLVVPWKTTLSMGKLDQWQKTCLAIISATARRENGRKLKEYNARPSKAYQQQF